MAPVSVRHVFIMLWGVTQFYADFEVLAHKNGLSIIDSFGMQNGRPVRRWPNLRASVAVFKFQNS